MFRWGVSFFMHLTPPSTLGSHIWSISPYLHLFLIVSVYLRVFFVFCLFVIVMVKVGGLECVDLSLQPVCPPFLSRGPVSAVATLFL